MNPEVDDSNDIPEEWSGDVTLIVVPPPDSAAIFVRDDFYGLQRPAIETALTLLSRPDAPRIVIHHLSLDAVLRLRELFEHGAEGSTRAQILALLKGNLS